MSVRSAFGQLEHARKGLLAQWETTRLSWNDENARRFDRDVMEPLMIQIQQMEEALNRLDVVLRRVQRDCE
jgi:hypothetical protein